MRIAILIVGLVVWLIALLQTLVVSGLSDAVNDEGAEQAAAVGFFGLLIWLFGLVIVIPWPRAAMWFFLAAGGVMFLGAGEFPDLAAWGVTAIIFGILSYFGLRQKRKADAKETSRDALMAEMVAQQKLMASPAPLPPVGEFVPCQQCGKDTLPEQVFCPWCGRVKSIASA